MAGSFICAYRLNGDGSGAAFDESTLSSVSPPSAPIWIHLSARSEAARHWLATQAQLPGRGRIHRQFISQIQGLHDHGQLMKPVVPEAKHLQVQVDLRRGTQG